MIQWRIYQTFWINFSLTNKIELPNKKYEIILADPPWSYRQSGGRGTAKRHYDTMSTDEICSLPVRSISTDNAICFMWATFPNIGEALKVLSAWQFEFKTAAFVWVKKNKKSDTYFWGMGAYTRSNAEVCLLGISKKTKAKEMIKHHTVHQIIIAPLEAHSQKPAIVRDRIIVLLGDRPRIELFARQQVVGWDNWGLEVTKFN